MVPSHDQATQQIHSYLVQGLSRFSSWNSAAPESPEMGVGTLEGKGTQVSSESAFMVPSYEAMGTTLSDGIFSFGYGITLSLPSGSADSMFVQYGPLGLNFGFCFAF